MQNKQRLIMKEKCSRLRTQISDLWGSPEHRPALMALIAVAVIGGALLAGIFQSPPHSQSRIHTTEADEDTIWTCSMHPQIRLPEPGQCPICAMDLVPVDESGSEAALGPRSLRLSETAAALADIQTTRVERKPAAVDVRMVGKVEYDETKIAYITAWTGGRIDRLFIDQTGVPIRKGDHMAYIYSPELLSAQEEYLQALEGVQKVQESHLDIIKSTSADTVTNAREKLKLLGVTEQQIRELEKNRKPSSHMTLYANADGIVVQREVEEGDYVKTGSRIYAIVDLNEVWISLDAYESDLKWLRYGQAVSFEAEAYPGEAFSGRISFIDPILDETTRTVNVRVIVENLRGMLKPGMFVRATVHADVLAAGRVMDSFLHGKFMCPMHPQVISESEGECTICDMPLVSSEKLGYTAVNEAELPLVIPASAVLKTGKRAVIYVKLPGKQEPVFEGREITLGPRAGYQYIVKAGLREGEEVVTHGNFKIDSALQIQAKPSMMNPVEDDSDADRESMHAGHEHANGHSMTGGATEETQPEKLAVPFEFVESLGPVYEEYFSAQVHLAKDEGDPAREALVRIKQKLSEISAENLNGETREDWTELVKSMQEALGAIEPQISLAALRENVFLPLSETLLRVEKSFGHAGQTHYRVFCPMVFEWSGASWLQQKKAVMNPYAGFSMQNCGTVEDSFPAVEANASGVGHVH